MARKAHAPVDVESEPFTPAQIARSLRQLSDEDLSAVHPRRYHMWPVRKIVPGNVILELIANERATRRSQ
jgi:predicted Zn-dependent protease